MNDDDGEDDDDNSSSSKSNNNKEKPTSRDRRGWSLALCPPIGFATRASWCACVRQ